MSKEVKPGIYELRDGRFIRCGYDAERLQYYGQSPSGNESLGHHYRETVGPNPEALASWGVPTFGTIKEAINAGSRKEETMTTKILETRGEPTSWYEDGTLAQLHLTGEHTATDYESVEELLASADDEWVPYEVTISGQLPGYEYQAFRQVGDEHPHPSTILIVASTEES